MGVKPREVDVRIGKLILHGVSPADALGVGEATKRELARLLSERDLADGLAGGLAIELLDGGDCRPPVSITPGTLGGEIAGAICGGICQ
jgi:hypothetical protein